MSEQNCPGVTIIDVENLGQPAMLVPTTGPSLLLLDAALSCDERIKILARFHDETAA